MRLTLTPRIGAEVYIEVETSQGRFWVRHDASVLDLAFKIQEGGFTVRPPTGSVARKRGSTGGD